MSADSERPPISSSLSSWLDAARGLAALTVFIGHSAALLYPSGMVTSRELGYGAVYASISWITRQAYNAVLLFFVLSGFLVGGPILRRVMRQQHINFPAYAAARISRLYTVLLPGLALTALVVVVDPSFFALRNGFYPVVYPVQDTFSTGTALCNLAFLQMISCWQYGANLSLWSLSNEGLYYLTFGLGVAALGRPIWWLAVVTLLGLMFSAEFFSSPEIHRGWMYLVYFGIWLLGAICFALDKGVVPNWLMALSACALAVVSSRLDFYEGRNLISDAVVGLIVAWCLVALDKFEVPAGIFGWRPFQWLAQMSFSLYVIHIPLIILMISVFEISPLTPSWAAMFVHGSLVGGILIASFLFYSITERNTPLLRRWLLQKVLALYRKQDLRT